MAEIVSAEVIEELLSLSDDGDPELLLDLIEMFLEDAPARIASIESALQSTDFGGIERAAHSLKGSAGNLGAVLLQADCETMQNAGRHEGLGRRRAVLPGTSAALRRGEDGARVDPGEVLERLTGQPDPLLSEIAKLRRSRVTADATRRPPARNSARARSLPSRRAVAVPADHPPGLRSDRAEARSPAASGHRAEP